MHQISSGARRWLNSQLPLWIGSGAISAEQGAAIEGLYGDSGRDDPRRVAFLLLAIIGSALVGSGIILLIAHNWDELSRPVRSVIAFAPLVGAQALSLFVMLRRERSGAWREGAAVFNVAAIGATISLVAQTYQIQGDFARFILVWMLLSLPLVYLLETTFGACAYLLGTIVWVMSTSQGGTRLSPLWFWVFAGAVMPFAASLFRRKGKGRKAGALAICLSFAAAFGLARTNSIAHVELWAPSFAGLFALVYLAGCAFFRDSDEHALHPLVLLGFTSTAALSIALSFQEFWRLFHWDDPQGLQADRVIAIALVALFVALPFALFAWLRSKRPVSLNVMALALPLVACLAWIIAQRFSLLDGVTSSWSDGSRYARGYGPGAFAAALLISFYVLSFGVFTLARGLRGSRFVEANVGLAIVAALAVARFFDSDFGFVARGVMFVVVGLGFLAANVMLFRKRAHA
jgi:uncharacterized membrane protein